MRKTSTDDFWSFTAPMTAEHLWKLQSSYIQLSVTSIRIFLLSWFYIRILDILSQRILPCCKATIMKWYPGFANIYKAPIERGWQAAPLSSPYLLFGIQRFNSNISPDSWEVPTLRESHKQYFSYFDMPNSSASDNSAEFLHAFPEYYCFVGSQPSRPGTSGIHHAPDFDLDESVLPRISFVFLETAKRLENM